MSELYVKYGKAYWCPVIMGYMVYSITGHKGQKPELSGSDRLTFILYFQFNGMYGLNDAPHMLPYLLYVMVCLLFLLILLVGYGL